MIFNMKNSKYKALIKREIRDIIRLIKEYLSSMSESIPPLIMKKIEKIAQDENYRKTVIEYSELGQSLFHYLQVYVKVRYMYLKKLIELGIISVRKPIFSDTIIFSEALKGNFPFSYPINVLGVSWKALVSSLENLKRYSKDVKKTAFLRGKKKKLPDILEYITEKMRKIKVVKKRILEELDESNQKVPLTALISTLSRPLSTTEAQLRLISILDLLREGSIDILCDDTTWVVRRRKNK